jgi:hypothetical protein
MAYSKVNLKSICYEASLCLMSLWIGKLSDKYLPVQTLVYIWYKHISIIQNNFMSNPKLYVNIVQYFPLTELHVYAFLKSMNRWRIASSGMLRHVALVRTDVSEELSASFIRMTRIGELGTTLALTSNRHMLQRNNKWYTVSLHSYFSPVSDECRISYQ